MNPFANHWARASDSEWLTTLIHSAEGDPIKDVNFPAFPAVETQRYVHGSSSNETSIRGAYRFYVEVRRAAQEAGRDFEPSRTFLDFGTGWGRIVRPFLRDFNLANIFAVEPNATLCETARKLNPNITILNSDYLPPLIFKNESVDYITAYSIFSHLPEELFVAWFHEFHRILKPGGLVCFTTLGYKLLSELEAEIGQKDIHFWHKVLIENLPPIPEARQRLTSGDMIFLKAYSTDRYGETFMSPEFVMDRLAKTFRIAHSNLTDMAQDFICVQKI
ncbi:MAG: hypothetical protein JWP25_2945 [Bradyrhizobium sp.]|jgi:SAM-dependent methyltransferase|nr:hypothetical protein [Bradyrhizobium sp.]